MVETDAVAKHNPCLGKVSVFFDPIWKAIAGEAEMINPSQEYGISVEAPSKPIRGDRHYGLNHGCLLLISYGG